MSTPAAQLVFEELSAAGFIGLGGFHPAGEDLTPVLPSGAPAQTVLMVGSAGPDFWAAFQAASEAGDGSQDPMDRFTRRVLNGLASRFGFSAVYPFEGPPYHPFQRWALRCGGFSQSPVGVLAHHAYGPWLGLRAAFLCPDRLPLEAAAPPAGPCRACADKPCMSACPVDAISTSGGYDVGKCRDHLIADTSVSCWAGCLARHACPVGRDHAPVSAQGRFHMESFTGLAKAAGRVST